jgi:tRNA U34 2-thiouridine synthase MnmA/TrmU
MKLLALLSGGLDSTLSVKVVMDLGFDVEAVHFTTPFCQCDKCSLDTVSDELGINVHHVYLGQEFLDLLLDPPHGFGSRMNICIDCRILMLKKAKELADNLGIEYFVTGEVLNQRPFSQRFPAMELIEREAGLEGRILRPLSGKLLPETELEKTGQVDRSMLHSIKGRRRIPQMQLAEELEIRDYPCPSGGCLLTDPQYAERLREHLTHEGKITPVQALLLKLGRHFRLGDVKVIVGRNEKENYVLQSMAEAQGIPQMSVVGHMGPTTLIQGETDEGVIDQCAALTIRYSDAPRDAPVRVSHVDGDLNYSLLKAVTDEELEAIQGTMVLAV